MYASEFCATCYNHRGSDGITGECRAMPPDQPTALPRVMGYKRTADTLAACGLYRPLVEPEAAAPETKAERIARLCKGGVTDLAELKRAIEGR